MMDRKRAVVGDVGFLIVDIQERLFAHVERSCEMLHSSLILTKALKLLDLPFVVTEQYPEKMGATLLPLRKEFSEKNLRIFPKKSFSCLGEPAILEHIISQPYSQWVLIGMEAHVCILQTAIDLIASGKGVIVLNDAITSRSIYDYSTAIAELRDWGARITSVETLLFELLVDCEAAAFKEISQLIK